MTITNELIIQERRLSADLSSIPTEDLKRELAQAIGITAKTLAYLAEIWAELERRGEDLSDLRRGLMSYLPLIAEGRLDPELVVRCAGQAMLLKAASELPLSEQRRLLDEGIKLIDIGEDGSVIERTKPVEQISAVEVRRVFAGGHLRSPAEQARLIAPPDRSPRRTNRAVIVKVRLTQEEYDRVRQVAASRGGRVPTVARDILMDAIR